MFGYKKLKSEIESLKSYNIGLKKLLDEAVLSLDQRIYDLEYPKRVTFQNLTIQRNRLYFNDQWVDISNNDIIEDANIIYNDYSCRYNNIFISMKSGDKYILYNYLSPYSMCLQKIN